MPLTNLHPHVTRQLIELAARNPEGPIDILLTPEELGRVRMQFTPAEAGMSVTIQAERVETSELLRRNIDDLAQEFRDLGYADVDFSFGREAENQHEPGGDGTAEHASRTTDGVGETLILHPTLPTDGLDLRL